MGVQAQINENEKKAEANVRETGLLLMLNSLQNRVAENETKAQVGSANLMLALLNIKNLDKQKNDKISAVPHLNKKVV